MDRSLDSLSDRFRPYAEALIGKCQVEGIPLVVICTRRTPEEQDDAIARGVSWTKRSKHLTGDAIDVATRRLMAMKNWGPGDPEWARIGEIGESFGLKWGVWVLNSAPVPEWCRRDGLVNIDLGHFEMKEIKDVTNSTTDR